MVNQLKKQKRAKWYVGNDVKDYSNYSTKTFFGL